MENFKSLFRHARIIVPLSAQGNLHLEDSIECPLVYVHRVTYGLLQVDAFDSQSVSPVLVPRTLGMFYQCRPGERTCRGTILVVVSFLSSMKTTTLRCDCIFLYTQLHFEWRHSLPKNDFRSSGGWLTLTECLLLFSAFSLLRTNPGLSENI